METPYLPNDMWLEIFAACGAKTLGVLSRVLCCYVEVLKKLNTGVQGMECNV
jgi:hypothetical protein